MSVETVGGVVSAMASKVEEVELAYGEDRPLVALASLIGAYGVSVGALSIVAKRRGRLPTRLGIADLALYAVATHKLTRILAKDPIASPIRAPFTTLTGLDGPAELHEDVRGEGWRHAVGELVTCPFCLGQWVGTAFVFGGMLAPRVTRAVAATFVVHAASDVLHHAYAALEDATST